jgi:hypothetical protein
VKPLLLTCGAFAFLALTGCAASTETDDDGQDAAVIDTGPGKDSTANKDAETACEKLECTTDTECQSTCPLVPNGIECCDTSTGGCYSWAATMCPTPVVDAGFD